MSALRLRACGAALARLGTVLVTVLVTVLAMVVLVGLQLLAPEPAAARPVAPAAAILARGPSPAASGQFVMPGPVTVVQAACPRTGTTPLRPKVTVPADTAQIVYTVKPAHGWHAGEHLTVSATTQGRYRLAAHLPTGWLRISPTLAHYPVALRPAPSCVVPVAPAAVQASCPSSGTTPHPPSLRLPNTPGIAYTAHPDPPYAAGQQVTVLARADHGYRFDTGRVPGWTRLSGTLERYRITFAAAPTCVDTIAPTFTDDQCVNSLASTAQFVIPRVVGAQYYVNAVPTAPGTYSTTDGATTTVTARPRAGVTLVGRTAWQHTFAPTPACARVQQAPPVSFAADTCSGGSYHRGSYTVPASPVVRYVRDGAPIAAGRYAAAPGTVVIVVAVPLPGHQLEGTTSWSHTFGSARACTQVAGAVALPAAGGGTTSAGAVQGLANTGVTTGELLGIGSGLLCLGTLLLWGGTRRRTAAG